MFAFEQRLKLAAGWLSTRVCAVEGGMAGWGWVADVHPNPQNTAEAVEAFLLLGQQVPRRREVVKLLRSEDPMVCHGQRWEFDSSIDVSARLRALASLAQRVRSAVPARDIDRLGHDLRQQ